MNCVIKLAQEIGFFFPPGFCFCFFFWGGGNGVFSSFEFLCDAWSDISGQGM
jgi:hypothetical protein